MLFFTLIAKSPTMDYDVALDMKRTADFYCRECIRFLGYMSNVAVSGCAAMEKDQIIHLFNLVTVPELRRRGYGTTILRYTMTEASRTTGV